MSELVRLEGHIRIGRWGQNEDALLVDGEPVADTCKEIGA